MLDFTRRNLEYVRTRLDEDGDGWPEGNGNVERPGHGRGEARQHRLLHPRPLRLRRHGALGAARRRRPTRPRRGPTRWPRASRPSGGSRPSSSTPTRCAIPATCRSTRSTGSASTRWRSSSTATASSCPASASYANGSRALATRENSCYSGERPGNRGLFHTGCGGGPDRRRRVRHLLAQHRRPGRRRGQLRRASAPEQQRRYLDANAETQLGQPVTGGTPDEQPGAMPEIMPSLAPDGDGRHAAEHRPLLDVPVDVHAGLGPLRHGVARHPPAARRAPAPRPRPAGGRAAGAGRPDERRRARTSASAAARPTCSPSRAGARYTTTTDTSDAPVGDAAASGTRCRAARRVASVELDGAR